MITEHDKDINPRCRRLGHEVNFGYCRQESAGRPCRLIFDCWWETFDVRAFLNAHLSPESMARLESAPPPSKVMSLLGLIQQAQERVAAQKQISENPPKS